MLCQTNSVRKVWTAFFLYSLAIFLIYSAFGSLLSLQSSLNIVDGVGTKTNAVISGSALFSSIVFLPLILRTIGPRKCVIVSGITYLLQTSANFYPVIYTLITSAIFTGIGDAILWTCIPIYVTFFAKRHAEVNQSGTEQISKFSGYFFAIFQAAKIAGSMVSYAVLQFVCNSDNCGRNASTSIMSNVTHCGANDCQDSDEIQDTIDNYVPNQVATYVLLGAMLFMQLTGTVLFVAFLPDAEFSTISDNDTQEQTGGRSKHLYLVTSTLKDTLRQMCKLKQILLLPGIFYAGLDYGFLTSEFTRSFTSCIFGVEWVPIHTAIYGISAAIVSFLGGKLSQYIPIMSMIVIAGLVDSGTHIYYFLWEPDNATQWAVIPAYMFSGGMQGIWISQSQAIQSSVFPKTMDVGSSLWNFWFMLGIAIQFAFSTSSCVDVKIIIHLTILGITLLGYTSLEVLRMKEKKRSVIEVVR